MNLNLLSTLSKFLPSQVLRPLPPRNLKLNFNVWWQLCSEKRSCTWKGKQRIDWNTSTIKGKNLTYTLLWMDLKGNHMLSKTSQSQKAIYILCDSIKVTKPEWYRIHQWLPRSGLGTRLNYYGVGHAGDYFVMEKFCSLNVGVVTQIYTCDKISPNHSHTSHPHKSACKYWWNINKTPTNVNFLVFIKYYVYVRNIWRKLGEGHTKTLY